ncbi:MAG: hypothetical protein QM718_06520 [Steroidobacteraceae bacterium]
MVLAAAAATDLPVEVQQHLAALDAECRSFGGVPGNAPELVRSADLTGDGVPDYLIDVNFYECEGAISAMSAGLNGSAFFVYMGLPGHAARQVYQGVAYGTHVESGWFSRRLYVDTAGKYCGQTNAADLPTAELRGCSRPLLWKRRQQIFVFAPLHQAHMNPAP